MRKSFQWIWLVPVMMVGIRAAEAADRFELRARVLKVKAVAPGDDAEFTIGYGGLSTKTFGSDWSAWLPCSELIWNKLRRDYRTMVA